MANLETKTASHGVQSTRESDLKSIAGGTYALERKRNVRDINTEARGAVKHEILE